MYSGTILAVLPRLRRYARALVGERMRAYREQKLALKALFQPVLNEPLPESLRAQAKTSGSTVSRPWPLQRMAAGLTIAVVSGALGWTTRGLDRSPDEALVLRATLSRQAAIAHVVFSPDVRRPVEVGADQEDQLVTKLSKRLGTPVRPPKLSPLGYELIGVRLLPGNRGPVAQFMYHDVSGQRLTLYVSTEIGDHQDTAFRYAREGLVNVFYWIDGKFGYALSAGISRNELSRVATAVHEQLENK